MAAEPERGNGGEISWFLFEKNEVLAQVTFLVFSKDVVRTVPGNNLAATSKTKMSHLKTTSLQPLRRQYGSILIFLRI
jgi:hypothetical protein